MKVRELRTVLEHLPDDLDVLVRAQDGGRVHIRTAVRRTACRWWPGALLLDGGWCAHLEVARTEPAPDFLLAGQFRDEDRLLSRLDPDIPLGNPADHLMEVS